MENLEHIINKAKQYLSSNGYFEAIKCLDEAIRLNKAFGEAYFLKGQCLYSMSKLTDSIKCFDKAIQLNHVGAYNFKAFLSSDKIERRFLANKAFELNNSPTNAQDHFEKGNSLYILKLYHDAIVCYNKAINLNPIFLDKVLNSKGLCFHAMGKHEVANFCYNKAIEVNPNNEIAFNNMGYSFKLMGMYNEAIECFNRSIELNPYDLESYYCKGVCFDKIGKFNEATDCYNKAIQLNSNQKNSVHNNMAILDSKGERSLKIDKHQETNNCLNNLNQLNSCQNIRNSLEEMGEFRGAIDFLNQKIKLNPK